MTKIGGQAKKASRIVSHENNVSLSFRKPAELALFWPLTSHSGVEAPYSSGTTGKEKPQQSKKHIASFLKRAYNAFKYTKMFYHTHEFSYFWETLVLEAVRSLRNNPGAFPYTRDSFTF